MSFRKTFSTIPQDAQISEIRQLKCQFDSQKDADEQFECLTFKLFATDNDLSWLPTQLGALSGAQSKQDAPASPSSKKEIPSQGEYLNPTSSQLNLLPFSLCKADPRDVLFERTRIERSCMRERQNETASFIIHSQITYLLPKNPQALLFFFAELLAFIDDLRKKTKKGKSQSNLKIIDNFLKTLFQKIDDWVVQSKNPDYQKAINLLKKIREMEKYYFSSLENQKNQEATLPALNNSEKKENETLVSLIPYLSAPQNQLLFFYFDLKSIPFINSEISFWDFSENSWDKNLSQLKEAIIDLKNADREVYIPILIQSFVQLSNQPILKSLYASAIGKFPTHGREFDWNSRETDFFLHAELKIVDDRLQFVNLENNPAYIRYYAKGKSGYSHFYKEMNDLIFMLGLELTPNSDCHQLFQLTLISTRRLLTELDKHHLFHFDEQMDLSLHDSQNLTQSINFPMKNSFQNANSDFSEISFFASSSSTSNTSPSSSNITSSYDEKINSNEPNHSQKKLQRYFLNLINKLHDCILRLGTIYHSLAQGEKIYKPALFQKNEIKNQISKFVPLSQHILIVIANATLEIIQNQKQLKPENLQTLIKHTKATATDLKNILNLFSQDENTLSLLLAIKTPLDLSIENLEWHLKSILDQTMANPNPDFYLTLDQDASDILSNQINSLLLKLTNPYVDALIDKHFDFFRPQQSHTRTRINQIIQQLTQWLSSNDATHSHENDSKHERSNENSASLGKPHGM